MYIFCLIRSFFYFKQRMKELEDRTEQNRTEILLKAAQRAISCGDGNELVTLEQLQEVGLIVNIIFLFLFLNWNICT